MSVLESEELVVLVYIAKLALPTSPVGVVSRWLRKSEHTRCLWELKAGPGVEDARGIVSRGCSHSTVHR